jgi:hypothetical protein
MEQWEQALRRKILKQRPICEICRKRYASQLHHAFIHDQKRYHFVLTCEENCMAVCEVCHTSGEQTANSMEVKQEFLRIQKLRGYDIGKWARGLPLRTVESWLKNG